MVKTALSASFNNPGFEPHPPDVNEDNPDGSPFTIPEYEEIPVASSRQSRRKSSDKKESLNPLYSGMGSSLAAKIRKTTSRAIGRLPTQIFNDFEKYQEQDQVNDFASPIANSNPIYEAVDEFKRKTSGINSPSHKDNLGFDTGARKNPPTGDPKGASADSGYSSVAKKVFHPDGNSNEEPLYSKPQKVGPRSALASSSPTARNTNYAQLGSDFQATGYAQLDPSTLNISGGGSEGNSKGARPRKSRKSQDHVRHANTVRPSLERQRVEDNGDCSQNENTAAGRIGPRPCRTRNSGLRGFPGQQNANQEAWGANSGVDETPILHLTTELGPEETII